MDREREHMHEQKADPFEAIQNFLAKMSGTPQNYWAEFAVDIPFGTALVSAGLRSNKHEPFMDLFIVLLGLVLYSIIEYSFHRWLFHGPVRVLAQGHRAHHANPLGYDSLPFFVPVVVLSTLTGILALIIPLNHAMLLVGTITLSYVVYGLSHFTIHHHRFQHAVARSWAAPHLIHHYHPDANFGVTTPLWDRVLGTYYKYDHKKIIA